MPTAHCCQNSKLVISVNSSQKHLIPLEKIVWDVFMSVYLAMVTSLSYAEMYSRLMSSY